MSVEQAMLIAVIGGLTAGIWAGWMQSPGEEWMVTGWVRRHWQRLAKKVKRRLY